MNRWRRRRRRADGTGSVPRRRLAGVLTAAVVVAVPVLTPVELTAMAAMTASGTGADSQGIGDGANRWGGQDTETAVRRMAGPDRVATAAAITRDGWRSSEVAVIVDGWDHVAALTGAHLAARLDAPILLATRDGIPDASASVLADLDVRDLVVIGDVAVPDTTVPGRVERIDDPDPPVLAAAVATSPLAGPGDALPVVLASHQTFADVLAAANLAPAVMLLTAPDHLSDAARRAIADHAPAEVVIVGGDAAVAPAVASAVSELGPHVRRVAGPDRHATAVAAADGRERGATEVASSEGRTVVLASGDTYADALAIVPWAVRADAPVLLTPLPELPAVVVDWVGTEGLRRGVVPGGTAAVGNFAERQLEALLTDATPPGHTSLVRPLLATEQEAMTGVSWHAGCPVPLEDLRIVQAAHWDFTGNVVDEGVLVVHAAHADTVAGVLGTLFDARFPIQRMEPIHVYGGDDDASMAANNSSAFNCRVVAGTTRWSEHAYGWAVDLNPVQNPFVRGDVVVPAAGRDFLDRTDVRPGMIVRPGPVVEAFAAVGWGWGQDFSTSDDYQHLSATGR